MMHSPHPRARYNVVIPTRYGMMIVNRNDWKDGPELRYGVGHELLTYGEYVQAELDEMAGLIRQGPPDPVLLDIGANIGVHTLVLSELAGPRGKVLAFEAQRIVFQMLMGNLALNSIENVHGHQLALGRAAGSLTLPPVSYSQPENFGGVSLAQAAPAGAGGDASTGESVTVATLDSFNLARVDFIKLDVEGMEEDVLAGASRTLDRTRPVMQVEWLGHDGRLPLMLTQTLDYRVFRAGMNLLCIPAERYGEIAGVPEITADGIKKAFDLP